MTHNNLKFKWPKSTIGKFLRISLKIIELHDGPCTFPQFNFSSFYLYMEDLLGSNVNVARDRIQFVA